MNLTLLISMPSWNFMNNAKKKRHCFKYEKQFLIVTVLDYLIIKKYTIINVMSYFIFYHK